mmetsp:Transcript_80/g.185  ORF Transcript_80/g.185 Transcript_80/m.185 type:complete len:273 (-) Transcript_80:1010-1828(-)
MEFKYAANKPKLKKNDLQVASPDTHVAAYHCDRKVKSHRTAKFRTPESLEFGLISPSAIGASLMNEDSGVEETLCPNCTQQAEIDGEIRKYTTWYSSLARASFGLKIIGNGKHDYHKKCFVFLSRGKDKRCFFRLQISLVAFNTSPERYSQILPRCGKSQSNLVLLENLSILWFNARLTLVSPTNNHTNVIPAMQIATPCAAQDVKLHSNAQGSARTPHASESQMRRSKELVQRGAEKIVDSFAGNGDANAQAIRLEVLMMICNQKLKSLRK